MTANVVDLTFADDSLITRLGISIVELGPDMVRGTMPVDGNRQTHGLLHGGASAALAETVGSLGAMMHARERSESGIAVGVDLSITHHRAVSEGSVTAVATSLHRGRTTATYEITITDTQERRVATARLTCVLKTQP